MAICLVFRTVKGNRHVVTPCKQPGIYRPGGCGMKVIAIRFRLLQGFLTENRAAPTTINFCLSNLVQYTQGLPTPAMQSTI